MIMRAEEECMSYGEVLLALRELVERCDAMDCQGITEVLRQAVNGFANHEIRHDHLWVKQGRAGKRRVAAVDAADPSKVKKLFPGSVAEG
jgi:hypothetical protein